MTIAASIDPRTGHAYGSGLYRILNPHSIAIIGAGRNRDNVGHALLLNVIAGGFEGSVYPINPFAEYVGSIPAYPSIADVPVPVDLAIIAVPAHEVIGVVQECIATNVGGIIVLSAGFSDADELGRRRQEDLLALVREHNLRLIGPNCLGLINTDPEISLHATFSPQEPLAGSVGLLSQSGAVGVEAMDAATSAGLGISTFVSVGNKADVSGNDMLSYWEHDEMTSIVMLYLESFGNPEQFVEIARRISRTKPIIAVKSGRVGVAASTARTHTGFDGRTDINVDALLGEAGVIRVDTVEEMIDVALVLDRQPMSGGKRVAIVGNSGGPAVMAADACYAAGLDVTGLSSSTRQRLSCVLPKLSHPQNPVDLLATARAADYEAVLSAVLEDQAVDSVVVIFTRVMPGPAKAITQAIEAVNEHTPSKPVVACFIGMGEMRSDRIPIFNSPERAVRALARATHYAINRRKDVL